MAEIGHFHLELDLLVSRLLLILGSADSQQSDLKVTIIRLRYDPS